MNKKYKIVALFGESASGKDTICKKIVSEYPFITHALISHTTRPPRDYEINGIDYHFISNVEFAEKVLDGSMLEATCFRDWHYGTALDALDIDKVNIGVFNITGIECLLEDNRLDVYPIYVYASPKTRLIRSLNREQNPDCTEICRRFLSDEKDFSLVDFDYEQIINEKDNIDIFQSISLAGLLGQK